jgi:hypothetical protein
MLTIRNIRVGDALAALGRKIGLTNEDFEVFDRVTDKAPAEPLRLGSPLQGRCHQPLGRVISVTKKFGH